MSDQRTDFEQAALRGEEIRLLREEREALMGRVAWLKSLLSSVERFARPDIRGTQLHEDVQAALRATP